MLLWIAILIAAVVCVGESIYERDWPRETIGYFVALIAIQLFCWVAF